MPRSLVQCAANFSEGRRPEAISAIVGAAAAPGAVVADWSADADHNRMVLTLVGEPGGVAEAVLAAARAAIERIDLRRHEGVHPRLGAVDVVPFTPLRDVTMAECVDVSRRVAERLGALGVPVYLYERSAQAGRAAALPVLRRGGFETIRAGELAGDRTPDFGPRRAHMTAGASVVGARPPLVAWNVELDAGDPAAARAIAAALRRERDHDPVLAGVRALGLWLPRRRCAQVSLNVTEVREGVVPAVLGFVRQEAGRHAVNLHRSEFIGLVPLVSLGACGAAEVLWLDYRPEQTVEYWLARAGV